MATMTAKQIYRKRNAAAWHSKRLAHHFCPRCSLRLDRFNPLTPAGHCQQCAGDLAAGTVVIGLYVTGG